MNIKEILAKFNECKRDWCDLPDYIYTKKYKQAFLDFVFAKKKAGSNVDAFTVVMILHHETGDRIPYFKFDREDEKFMHGISDEKLATMSKEEAIEALKQHIDLRNQMGGALYLAILSDECIELAKKCISLGADRNEIMALL